MKKRILTVLLCAALCMPSSLVSMAAQQEVVNEATECEECQQTEGHLETCSKYAKQEEEVAECEECKQTEGHLETCSQYVKPEEETECEECKQTEGHLETCSQYVTPEEKVTKCEECQQTEGHLETCSQYTAPEMEVPLCEKCNAVEDEDGNVVHEENCELYIPVEESLKDILMATTSTSEMYEVVLGYMNNEPETLLALTAEEIAELREYIAELDPENDDEDTADLLDTLAILPNGGEESEAVALGNGCISTQTCTGEKFFENADVNGNLKLLGNITVTSPIVISRNEKLILDLNGYVLSGQGVKNIEDINEIENVNADLLQRVIVVYGELIINDSNPDNQNKGSLKNVSRWIDKRLDGSQTTADGKVYENLDTYIDRYYWDTTTTEELWVYDGSGSTIIEGGIITGGAQTSGAGIYVGGGKLTINAGTIAGNRSVRYIKYDSNGCQEAFAGNGGGIYATAYGKKGDTNYRESTVIMNGGSVKYNWTDSLGGGIALNGNTKFYMHSGNLTENCAQGSGGGITVRGGSKFYLGTEESNPYTNASVPVIEGNKTFSTRYHGGGAGVEVDGGFFEYVVGQIKKNHASGSGGGIYCYRGGSVNARTEKSVISENHANGSGGGIFLQYGDVILEDCKLENNHADASGGAVGIRVGNFEMIRGTITNNEAENHGGAVYVTAQNNYSPHGDVGSLSCSASIKGTLVENNEAGDHGGALYVSVVNSTNDKPVEVNVVSCTIKNNHAGTVNDRDAGYGGAVYLSGGTLTVKEDAAYGTTEISGNTAHGGGAFYVEDRKRNANDKTPPYSVNEEKLLEGTGLDETRSYYNAELTLDQIIPFSDTKPGIIEIYAGTIKDNHATKNNGGAIYITGEAAEMHVYGGDLTLNTAEKAGGAIYVGGGNFTMNGGSLTKNSAEEDGGALYVKSTKVTLTGGNITYNKANNGAGIYATESATIELKSENGNSSIINNNIASKNGGGIYASASSVTIQNGEVNENNALNGGGIYAICGADVTMSGTSAFIRENEAGDSSTQAASGVTTSYHSVDVNNLAGVGGGVFLANGTSDGSTTFTMGASTVGIFGNTAGVAAADVFANGSYTQLTVPDVKTMSLSGMSGVRPTGWFEDYNKGDTKYPDLNNAGLTTEQVKRYKNAGLNVVEFAVDKANTAGKYVCMTLGIGRGDITIQKAGETVGEEDVFTFNVKGTPIDGSEDIDLNVTVQGIGEATIYSLPYGTYTITEVIDESWRYGTEYTVSDAYDNKTDGVVSLNDDNKTQTIIVTNTLENDFWRNVVDIEKNIYKM